MPEVDKELAKSIVQAKKKPRNFAIVAKGSNVLKLAVDKRPIKDGSIAKWKKDTGGNIVLRGVVQGTAEGDLVFLMLEASPITEAKLKKFIGDTADLTTRPVFKVVPALAEVDDQSPDEQEGKEGEATEKTSGVAETPTPSVPPPPPPPPPVTAADPALAFNARLKELMPEIKQASAGAQGTLIKQTTAEAGAAAQKKDFALAHQLLDKIEELLIAEGIVPNVDANKADRNEFPKRWALAKKTWLDSLDTVNDQISKLAEKLKQTDDPELKKIAEFGLAALTGNFKVPMMAGIRDVDDASAAALRSMANNLQDVIDGFKTHLASSARIQACDDDGQELFGVKTTIRVELTRGLSALRAALAYVADE